MTRRRVPTNVVRTSAGFFNVSEPPRRTDLWKCHCSICGDLVPRASGSGRRIARFHLHDGVRCPGSFLVVAEDADAADA